MKILISVMSSECLKDRREGIIDSWGKLTNNDIDLLFYSDDEDPLTNTHRLNCSFTYSYNDNEIKTLTSFKMINEKFNGKYDWYLWVDDDTFVNVPLLYKMIDGFNKECITGRIIHCWGDLEYLSGGAGFVAHNNMLKELAGFKNYKMGYNDVSMGYNFREKNIKICNSNYFDPENPYQNKNLHQASEQFKERITYHRLNPLQMRELLTYLK